jgi:Protein of unknown function (DUF664)
MADTIDHTEPPVAGTETETLLGSLERQRTYLAWKCGGLDAAGMRATVGSSTMTLGGLLKHLTLVEDEYFTHRLYGRELPRPGTPSTGTPTRTGSGALPPKTHRSNSCRAGGMP